MAKGRGKERDGERAGEREMGGRGSKIVQKKEKKTVKKGTGRKREDSPFSSIH